MVKLSKGELARQIKEDVLFVVDYSDSLRIDDLIAQYGNGLILRIENDSYYDECSCSIKVVKEREENDAEYEERLAELRKMKAQRALEKKRVAERAVEKDRQLFESLKNKHNW